MDAAQVFSVPGVALDRELGYFVETGLSPTTGIANWQFQPRNILQLPRPERNKSRRGSRPVLLGAKPLENIKAINGIKGIMLNGRWLSKGEIDKILQGLKKW